MGTKNNPYRLDARESAFFARELEYIKSRTYDTKFKPKKYAEFIPVSTEADPAAEEITFRSFTEYGLAKVISDYSEDLPNVDVLGEESTAKVKGIGSQFQYSIMEIRRSQREGRNLPARRATAARNAIEQRLNKIAWSGDSNYNVQGLIDYPGISEYSTPNGSSGDSEFSTKTPDEIIKDLAGIVTGIIDSTNGVEVPDTLLIPIDQYNYIANTRMTGNSDKTILSYFLENNPYVESVHWLPELAGAGAGGSDRMIAYTRDEMKLTFELPQAIEQFPPQQKNLAYKVPVHARTGGVIVYYPLSVAFADNI